jgi:MtN3 and saliva related transmembrane protein
MELFGWLGLGLIQVFYVPQIIKTFKTRDVRGLSLSAWIILWSGLFCYLIYSITRRDPVFITGQGIGLLQTSLLIGLILKFRKLAGSKPAAD